MNRETRDAIEGALKAGDIESFVRAVTPVGVTAAVRHGFGGVAGAGPLPHAARLSIVENRSLRAVSAISELQAWLHDDDASVRRGARLGLHRCLYAAYTGDRPEAARGALGGFLTWLDSRVSRTLDRNVDPDKVSARTGSSERLGRIRTAGITAGICFGFGAAVLFSSGWALLALVAVVCGGALDVLEGSLARAAHLSDARQRWLSCVASHLSDAAALFGLAVGLYVNGMSSESLSLQGAAVLSLVASLTRVSALQAGYRFWRSRTERVVRYTCIGVLGIDLANGEVTVYATVFSIGLLVGFALWEIQRVARAVQHTEMHGGGLILFASPDEAACWSFDSDEAAQGEQDLDGHSLTPA